MTAQTKVQPAVQQTVARPASGRLRLDGLRVLVLFGGSDLFGQERGNLEVFRSLAELGLKARFITSSTWGHRVIQPELDRLGFEWTTAPFGYHWTKHMLGKHFGYFLLNIYGVMATSWRLWHEARRWKPTYLYVMNWRFFSYVVPAILSLRLPLIYRAGDDPPMHTAFHRWVCRRLFGRVSQMVCISNFIMECYKRAGMSPERMRVIYNYPPQRSREAKPVVVPTTPGATVILFIGQFAEFKGVGILVDAVRALLRAGRNIDLWIAGEAYWGGEFVSKIRSQIAVNRLESRIQLLGYVENVAALLQRADIHVCPSICKEALGNVVLEAKAEGVPSVVFPDGGLPELIEHGVDGYICGKCTVEALMEGIEYFLKDAVARQKAGAAARKSLEEKFGLERFRREWSEVLLSTVGAGKANPECV